MFVHGYAMEDNGRLEPLETVGCSNYSHNYSFRNSKQLFLLGEHPMYLNCLTITHDGTVDRIV